jgi:hypothetical protein
MKKTKRKFNKLNVYEPNCVMDAFVLEIGNDGYIIDKKTKRHVLDTNGEAVKAGEFIGVTNVNGKPKLIRTGLDNIVKVINKLQEG